MGIARDPVSHHRASSGTDDTSFAAGNGYFSVVKEGGRYLVRHAAQLPKELRTKSPYGMLQLAGAATQFRQAMAMADKLVERTVPNAVLSQ